VHIAAWRPDGPISTRFEAFLGAVGRKDQELQRQFMAVRTVCLGTSPR